jgi:hypothetical protein
MILPSKKIPMLDKNNAKSIPLQKKPNIRQL